jgi:hypothetical protein
VTVVCPLQDTRHRALWQLLTLILTDFIRA